MPRLLPPLLCVLLVASGCTFGRADSAPQGSPTFVFDPPSPQAAIEDRSDEDIPQDARPEVAFKDLGQVGSASRAILQPDPYQRVILEIDWVQGREPTEDAIGLLALRIKEITGKDVVLRGGGQIPGGSGDYYPGEIREMSRGRSTFTGDGEVSIWIGYLNGGAAARLDAVGGSVGATVMVIFPDRIEGFATEAVKPDAIERATLIHEFGHLMGLVNIGYESPRDHEDDEHAGHSSNPASVMHWGIERLRSLTDATPSTTFDANDLADLADLAAGRL